MTQPQAAELLHVSPRSVASAVAVREHGAPGLAERVESGEVAVSLAAEVAKLSVGDQVRLLQERNPREFAAAVRHERQKPKDARAVTNSRVQPPDDLDYSPTPPWATRSLTKIVLPHLGVSLAGMVVREPACGEGHITAVLQEERPPRIWASDIFDYSVDGVEPPEWTGDRDYLDPKESFGGGDWVITNSPFGTEDVPLHMGRWEPDGSTMSDYMWLVWIKGEVPRAPFWIPPEQRTLLSKPDDVARFTAHPVVGLVEAGSDATDASSAIAHTMASAEPILRAKFTGNNAAELAAELGRPIGTIRTWTYRLGLTDRARLQNNAAHLGGHLGGKTQ